MNRFWLESYPSHTPHDIDSQRYQSISDVLHHSCEHFPHRPAFSNFGTTLTFAQLDSQITHFAAYLQHQLAMRKGDRLGIMLPNILQYPIALFAAFRIGLVVVNIDPLYTARELHHQLKDSGADSLVFLANFSPVVKEAIKGSSIKHTIVTEVGDCLDFPKSILINSVLRYVKRVVPKNTIEGCINFNQALKEGQLYNCEEVTLTHNDIAFLQYTGGTTGVSKGAILTHKNIISNILQAAAWVDTGFDQGKEVAITALPLYHIFSLTANCLFIMSIGGENVLITNPRDFKQFVRFLQKQPFSVFMVVNTLLRKLLNTEGFDQVDFSGLKLCLSGGMAVTEDVAKEWNTLTNNVIIEAYGLTETSPAVCINPVDLDAFNGMIGLPIPSTEVQIKDDIGNDVGIDQPGELCIRGPQVTQGYWQREEQNNDVFTTDGFFRTGDIAQINAQGFVKILDRKKDMILVSGFNVYPNEIENIVSLHDDVTEAAAVGIADAQAGEVVKLYVVKANPRLDEQTLAAYCKENLTGYKRPKEIVFVDELPKTNVGKICRKDLR